VTTELTYAGVLFDFCRTHSEESLYQASILSATFIQQGLGPDEIVAMHFDAVQVVSNDESFSLADRIRVLNDAHQFLLEVMIGYGAQYKEFLDLKLDAAVRRAESAERSEREKLEILAMIAHELGNPITIALGNMQIASRFLDADDLTNVRGLISDSREALDRLAVLTRQIVSASQNEEPEIEFEEIDVKSILERISTWAAKAAADKDLSFKLDLCEHPGKLVGNDPAMTSVITNLISNAIRYTPRGGSIVFGCDCTPRDIKIFVSDTGIGMSAEDQARIFEKFYRGGSARRMDSNGLGMGLAIASRLVTAQGGKISVASRPGQGSTFTVTFPVYGKEE
jgi:signal transduction histidine kinase